MIPSITISSRNEIQTVDNQSFKSSLDRKVESLSNVIQPLSESGVVLKYRVARDGIQHKMKIRQNENLLNALESGLYSDFTIRVGEDVFTAHRCILSCFEDYLEWAGFELDPSQKKQEMVAKRGTPAQHRILLRLIYGGEKPSVSVQEKETHEFKSMLHKLYFTDKRAKLRERFIDAKFADFRMNVGTEDRWFYGHKVLLATGSSYLSECLSSNHFVVPEVQKYGKITQNTVDRLVGAMYYGTLDFNEQNTWDEVVMLLCLAHSWRCKEIHDLCSLELEENWITKENALILFKFSVLVDAPLLYAATIDFSLENSFSEKMLDSWSAADIYLAAKEKGDRRMQKICKMWALANQRDIKRFIDVDTVDKTLQFALSAEIPSLQRACERFIERSPR